MRYGKTHKDATRQRILDVAGRRFREDGVAAAGLAGLMADAGLTNGAFYTHFDSKEDLLRQVLREALRRHKAALRDAAESGAGLEPVIRGYLSARHRNDAGDGCPVAALAAEVARHPVKTRATFTRQLVDVIDEIARQLPADTPEARRRGAIALYGLMIGTLQLSRAVSDKALSDEILASGLDAALKLAGWSTREDRHREVRRSEDRHS